MSWLIAALSSSVGKKLVMGITGLFLCLFLVIHLAGNLLLYVGAETYNDYAHKLHSMPEFLVTAEIFLYTAFAFHIALAISLVMQNRAARQKSYALKQTKVDDRIVNFGWTPDSTMALTGSIVLLFLIVHLSDFKFESFWDGQLDELEPFDKAKLILGDTTREVIYLIGSLVLAVHVGHGFASAFQSLGLNHPRYNSTIKLLSRLFAIVVAVGFGSFFLTFFISRVMASANVG